MGGGPSLDSLPAEGHVIPLQICRDARRSSVVPCAIRHRVETRHLLDLQLCAREFINLQGQEGCGGLQL